MASAAIPDRLRRSTSHCGAMPATAPCSAAPTGAGQCGDPSKCAASAGSCRASATIAARPLFDLIELASGYLEDAPELLDDAKAKGLTRAREAASLTFGWINDVFSYRKEAQAGDPLNLVAVLENQYSLSHEEAFDAAVDVFRAELSLLEDESARLREGGVSPTLDRYLTGLEVWLHGNIAWSSTCPRYR